MNKTTRITIARPNLDVEELPVGNGHSFPTDEDGIPLLPAPPLKKSSMKLVYHIYLLCVMTLIYCLLTSFCPTPVGVLEDSDELDAELAPDGCDDGLDFCVCPREAVCATRWIDMVYLGIARGSVYAVYPFIMLLFVSKASHLLSMMQRSVFSVWIDFADLHHLHTFGGKVVEAATWIHVFFHLLRWGTRGNDEIHLLWNHQTGVTGLIATVIMPFITWPMASKFLHDKMSFESRKSLHYLSWIWGLALVFHAPAVNIFYVMGIPLLIYFLNYLIGTTSKTFNIQSTIFRKLDNGVSLSFVNPKGFELQGASYIVIMIPWISKVQWHAFSVFPHPSEPDQSSLCIAAVGDWSKELHNAITRPTSRPAWISGPFLTPFAHAMDFDNIVTFATGIGITPAMAVMNMFRDSRRVHLVWMCRDPSFVEFFVSTVEFPPESFILIYYTGKKKLVLGNDVPSNVFLFKGRPDLCKVVLGLIHRIELKQGLPEEVVAEGRSFASMETKERFYTVLGRVLKSTNPSEFFDLASTFSGDKKTMEDGTVKLTSSRRLFAAGGGRMSATNIRNSARGIYMRQSAFTKTKTLGSDFISKEGLADAINDYLGRDEFLPEDLIELFRDVDKNGDGFIDRTEFTRLLLGLDLAEDSDDDSYLSSDDDNEESVRNRGSWMQSRGKVSTVRGNSLAAVQARNDFSPGNSKETSSDEDMMKFALKNEPVLQTWQMLYCGGSNPVVSKLKEISTTFKIDLRIEKFDW